MTVEPGFGGQKFMSDMCSKMQHVRSARPNMPIQVDGGIGLENIDAVASAGATMIVAGSSIFKSPNPDHVMVDMKRSLVSDCYSFAHQFVNSIPSNSFILLGNNQDNSAALRTNGGKTQRRRYRQK